MPSDVHRASDLLKAGGLVAFPTETVYGLGADAFQEAAVRRIFQVKGRPTVHPLIVHLGDPAQLVDWVKRIPETAHRLTERFWPGPLTVILEKSDAVLPLVTGGQGTVGLRVPSHPLALELLREFKGGIAAPSANRFGRVSPTTADHVRKDLGSDVDLILDGGPCQVGIESTILDLSSGDVVLLRPGGVTVEAIEEVLGRPLIRRVGGSVRASGMLESHYAPRAVVELVVLDQLASRRLELERSGMQVAVLSAAGVAPDAIYASLRQADESGVDIILAPLPGETGLELAVRDRLRKASAPRKKK